MASFFNNHNNDAPFSSPMSSPSNSTAAAPSNFTARLARTQTPLPSLFQLGSSSQDSNDADEEDNKLQDGEQDHGDDDDEDQEHKGRSDPGVIDLTRSSLPVFQFGAFSRARSVSPTLALQADNMTKRIRLSPGAESRHKEKRVRFDLSLNSEYVYDSCSLPSSPEVICLDDTEQELELLTSTPEILDFAQILNRVVGGSSSSQESNFSMSPPSSQGSNSPTFHFRRPSSPLPPKPFFSYSPPPSSSLSSCWSPDVSDDDDDDNNDDDEEEQDEDVSMQLAHNPLFSSLAPPPPAAPAVQEEKPRFVPRRPRDTTNRFSPTAAPAAASSSSSSQEKPGFVPRRPRDTTNLFSRPATVRFPSTLKRESSHASFLVTAPDMLERSPSPSRILGRGSSPRREEINIPALTKSLSDLSSSNIPSPPDSQLV